MLCVCKISPYMRYSLIALINLLAFSSFAQDVADTTWRRGGNAAFFLQQVGVKNWVGGGESSMSFGEQVSLFTDVLSPEFSWEYSMEAAYVLPKRKNIPTRKNVDYLILR